MWLRLALGPDRFGPDLTGLMSAMPTAPQSRLNTPLQVDASSVPSVSLLFFGQANVFISVSVVCPPLTRRCIPQCNNALLLGHPSDGTVSC
jgi:hypothetical protein